MEKLTNKVIELLKEFHNNVVQEDSVVFNVKINEGQCGSITCRYGELSSLTVRMLNDGSEGIYLQMENVTEETKYFADTEWFLNGSEPYEKTGLAYLPFRFAELHLYDVDAKRQMYSATVKYPGMGCPFRKITPANHHVEFGIITPFDRKDEVMKQLIRLFNDKI